jgi:hypothetical protein
VLNAIAALAALHIKCRAAIASIMLTSFALDIDHACFLVLDAKATLSAFHIKYRI